MRQSLDFYKDVNKVSLVPATASTGKRGKGAGFYCEACNLTFKDNIQYIDHINSPQHLQKTGESDQPPRATLEQVKERIDMLYKKKKHSEANVKYDIHAQISAIQAKKDALKQKKQQAKEQRRSTSAATTTNTQDDDVLAAMGISGFGTSKR